MSSAEPVVQTGGAEGAPAPAAKVSGLKKMSGLIKKHVSIEQTKEAEEEAAANGGVPPASC